MKKILLILFFIPVVLFSQKLADKEYYLVDSLNLQELSKSDRGLLDSCLMAYHTADNDTSKINALNDVCDFLNHEIWSDYQFVQYQLIEKALKENPNINEEQYLLLSKRTALNNIGIFYEFQKGNISVALDYYLKGLKLGEQLNDSSGVAVLLNRIGTIYINQDDVEKGVEYFKKSLNLFEQIGNEKEKANVLNNLGSYYTEIRDYHQALDFYHESLAINKEVGNLQGVAISLSNIGKLYLSMQEEEKALIYFVKGLNTSKQTEDKDAASLILSNIAKIYYNQEDYATALINAEQSLQLAQKIDYPKRISVAAKLLSDIYSAQGNKAQAYDFYKLHITMRDKVSSESTKLDALRQQSKYEFDKQKAIDAAEYDKKIAIEQEGKQRQKIIIYAIFAGAVLLIVFLVFVANRLKITRKQKNIIEEAHEELSEKNREILDSINYAKRIQSAILPADELIKENLTDSFVLYKPKAIVAGDFYWMESVASSTSLRGTKQSAIKDEIASLHKSSARNDDSLILFAAADCTGHGVPGAMLSVVCHNALNRSVREFGLVDPGEILDKTREIVIDEFDKGKAEDDDITSYVKDGMDIALCSLNENTLQYAGANNPLWIVRDNNIIETKANKQPIGRFRRSDPFTTHVFELQKNDIVYIFSDGYVDQFGGEKGKKFKAKAFKELLLSIQEKTMKEQKAIINKVFEDWKGDLEQIDDVCVIGVRV